MGFKVIAFDGGAASGKSSTAKALCDRFHFLHVDTGAHYRAVTLACLNAKVMPEAGKALSEMLNSLSLGTRVKNGASMITLNGYCPDNHEIRSPEVNQSVSLFAALSEIREKVKRYQREQVQVAKDQGFNGLIMDGRDIGTVIFPEADLKVFLYADESKRNERRVGDGQSDSISERDRLDSTRKTAPLKPAEDARILDNTNLSLIEVVNLVSGWIESL